MSKTRDFKKLVRARMRKTGESYTAARATLLKAGAANADDLDEHPSEQAPDQQVEEPRIAAPRQRGSIRGDLLIAVVILAAMALCGCDKEPPPVGSNEQCEAESYATGDERRQTCYLRAIWRRLDSLPLCVDASRPPSPPATAPDATPQPRPAQKTPMSEDCPYVGQNGGRN